MKSRHKESQRYPGCTRYGEVAINNEVDRMLHPSGSQEFAIRAGCFRIGQLVAREEITESHAQRTLDWLGDNIPDLDPGRPWDRDQLRRDKMGKAFDQGKAAPWDRNA